MAGVIDLREKLQWLEFLTRQEAGGMTRTVPNRNQDPVSPGSPQSSTSHCYPPGKEHPVNLRPALLLAAALAALALTGCASTGTSGPPAVASTIPGVTPAAASSEPSAVASSGPCLTKACIVSEVKQSLVGGVAKDESVMTKMTCVKSTVKQPTPGVYTVRCTATYSDGTVYTGIASLLTATSRVTWEPTGEIS
jgi:hypothetical protein